MRISLRVLLAAVAVAGVASWGVVGLLGQRDPARLGLARAKALMVREGYDVYRKDVDTKAVYSPDTGRTYVMFFKREGSTAPYPTELYLVCKITKDGRLFFANDPRPWGVPLQPGRTDVKFREAH